MLEMSQSTNRADCTENLRSPPPPPTSLPSCIHASAPPAHTPVHPPGPAQDQNTQAPQAAITDSRRCRRQCSIALPAVTNAIGIVPRGTIPTALQYAGLNEETVGVIRHPCATNTTRIRSHQRPTSEISIQAGVKQRRPLNPIIFNLTMEPIIRAIMQLRSGRGYSLHGEYVDALACADDLTFVLKIQKDFEPGSI